MIIVVLSSILGYVLAANSYVSEALRADLMRQPPWARHPTLGKIFLHGALWPVGEMINAPSARVGAFAVTYQFFVLSFLSWCCISVSAALFTNTLLQILSVAAGVFAQFFFQTARGPTNWLLEVPIIARREAWCCFPEGLTPAPCRLSTGKILVRRSELAGRTFI
jgi:hypothetical protein